MDDIPRNQWTACVGISGRHPSESLVGLLRITQAGNVFPQLIAQLVQYKVWSVSQALAYIRQMPDTGQQADAIIHLIPYLSALQFNEVLAITRLMIDKKNSARILIALVRRLPEISEEALATVRVIKDETVRAWRMVELAEILPEAQLLQLLIDATKMQKNDLARNIVLSALVQRMPEITGDVLVSVGQTKDEVDRANSLATIAQHVKIEWLPYLLELVRQFKNEWAIACVLSSVAQRFPEFGVEALSSISRVQHEETRSEMLSTLILHLPDYQLQNALLLTREIQDKRRRAFVLGTLAQRLPMIFDEAMDTVQQIEDYGTRAQLLGCLAQCLPDTIDEALAVAQQVDDEEERAWILSEFARQFPTTREKALSAARQVLTEYRRALLLSDLAQYLPEIVEESLALTWQIGDKESFASLLSVLAQVLPEAGWEAITATKLIFDEGSRATIFSGLVKNLSEAQLQAVYEVILQMRGGWERTRALGTLSKYLPVAGGDALAAAQSIEDERTRVDALRLLVPLLPENLLTDLLSAVSRIKDAGIPGEIIISTLAQRLPEVKDEILAAAQKMKSEVLRARLLTTLTQRFPECGGKILTVAQQIRDEEACDEIQYELVRHLIDKNHQSALVVAQQIKNRITRVDALCIVSEYIPAVAADAISEAWLIEDYKTRAKMLNNLVLCLPENQLQNVLTSALEIKYKLHRADVLCALAQRFPEVVGTALGAIQQIDYEISRARNLTRLTNRLNEENLPDALSIARQIHDTRGRSEALSSLAQYFSEIAEEAFDTALQIEDESERAIALVNLAKRLPENYLPAVLVVTSQIDKEKKRAEIMSALAQRFPKPQLKELLAAALEIRTEWARASVLKSLAQYMPDAQLHDVLVAARQVVSERNRTDILVLLAQRLPKKYFSDLLAAVHEIQHEVSSREYQTRILLNLVEYSSEDQLEDLMAVVCTLPQNRHKDVLQILIKPLITLSLIDSYHAFDKSIYALTSCTRADLCSDIEAIIPWLIHLGSNDTPREIYQAVKDVTTWWP